MNALFDVTKPTPADAPPAPETPASPKKPRKPAKQSTAEKLRFAEQAVIRARAATRRVEQNRARIIGIAIIKGMSEDAAFKAAAVTILKKHVTSQSSLIEIADLLIEPKTNTELEE